jgi:hypothetical protein
MPPLGVILVMVGTLGLIGLGVAAVIGAAVVVVSVVVLAVIGWQIYRHVRVRPRNGHPQQFAQVRSEGRPEDASISPDWRSRHVKRGN